jgi:hypothetical protein
MVKKPVGEATHTLLLELPKGLGTNLYMALASAVEKEARMRETRSNKELTNASLGKPIGGDYTW